MSGNKRRSSDSAGASNVKKPKAPKRGLFSTLFNFRVSDRVGLSVLLDPEDGTIKIDIRESAAGQLRSFSKNGSLLSLDGWISLKNFLEILLDCWRTGQTFDMEVQRNVKLRLKGVAPNLECDLRKFFFADNGVYTETRKGVPLSFDEVSSIIDLVDKVDEAIPLLQTSPNVSTIDGMVTVIRMPIDMDQQSQDPDMIYNQFGILETMETFESEYEDIVNAFNEFNAAKIEKRERAIEDHEMVEAQNAKVRRTLMLYCFSEFIRRRVSQERKEKKVPMDSTETIGVMFKQVRDEVTASHKDRSYIVKAFFMAGFSTKTPCKDPFVTLAAVTELFDCRTFTEKYATNKSVEIESPELMAAVKDFYEK